ncbi:MAG: hypothetical protein EP335_01685 [Alphaproteobacteria bacterium]|nr:MAG: hypothetical protein EP335_01685 [Alphaproteobacteria bacterium]
MKIDRSSLALVAGTFIASLFVSSEVCTALLALAFYILPTGPLHLAGLALAIVATPVFFLWFWRWAYRNERAAYRLSHPDTAGQ